MGVRWASDGGTICQSKSIFGGWATKKSGPLIPRMVSVLVLLLLWPFKVTLLHLESWSLGHGRARHATPGPYLGIVPKLFPQAPPAPWPMQDMVDTPPAKRQLFSSPGSFPASDSQVGLRVPLIWKNYVKLLGIIYCHDSDLFSTT